MNNKTKSDIPQRVMQSVPCDELLEMLKLVKKALKPKVNFTNDMKEMEEEANSVRNYTLQELEILIQKHTKFL